MKERGLSIDLDTDMLRMCLPTLRRLLGNGTYERYERYGWIDIPILQHLYGTTERCITEARMRVDNKAMQSATRGISANVVAAAAAATAAAAPSRALPAWRPSCSLTRAEPSRSRSDSERGSAPPRLLEGRGDEGLSSWGGLASFSRYLSWWRLGDDVIEGRRGPEGGALFDMGQCPELREESIDGSQLDDGRATRDMAGSTWGSMGQGVEGGVPWGGPEGRGSFALALRATEEAFSWVRLNAREYRLRPRGGWFGELSLATSHWPPSTFMFR